MRGEMFPEWARPKEGRSGAGHRLPAPVPRGRELPGKPAGASGSGGLTGQRARASAGRGPEQARNGTGEPCWARGRRCLPSGSSWRGGRSLVENQTLRIRTAASHAPFAGALLSKPPAYGRYSDLL